MTRLCCLGLLASVLSGCSNGQNGPEKPQAERPVLLSSKAGTAPQVETEKTPTFRDDKTIGEVVKVEVKKMIEATAAGNYDVVLELTHPRVVEELGGKEKAGQAIKKALEGIKARGVQFEVKEINEPTVVKRGASYFAVAPYTMVMTGSGKKATSKTALVGVSIDEGKTWKFLNVDAGGEDKIRQTLPDLPRELRVPRQEQKIEENP
jgi:hypothetical protein